MHGFFLKKKSRDFRYNTELTMENKLLFIQRGAKNGTYRTPLILRERKCYKQKFSSE